MSDSEFPHKESFDWGWFFLCAFFFVWGVLWLLDEYNVIEGMS